jgi:hypothetical protein
MLSWPLPGGRNGIRSAANLNLDVTRAKALREAPKAQYVQV